MTDASTDDCDCGLDGFERVCIDGTVYGLCESEFCNGGCEDEGGCECACHAS